MLTLLSYEHKSSKENTYFLCLIKVYVSGCSRFVTGCKECEDPAWICHECEDGKFPNNDKTECGSMKRNIIIVINTC